jgi:hypothetical protein
VWWARNVGIDGDPFGRRSESRFDVADVLEQLLDGLSSVALPSALPLALRLALLVPVLAAACLAWRRGPRVPVVVLTASAAVYTIAVTVAATRTVVDPVDTRLLAPILVPMAVLVAVGIASPRSRLERGLGGVVLVLVAVMAVLAPGVAWRGHEAERSLSNIPDDLSCADWPAEYSGTVVGLARHGR